ncbi:cytochrome c oxidase assembly protein [Amycolatopsis sp. NPDC003861]
MISPVAPLTWSTLLTEWNWSPVPLALTTLLGSWYFIAVRKVRQAGQDWPRVRVVWWYLGLASYVLVTVTVFGAYESILFSVRALQVTTLLMITPQFLAHALPLTLLRDTVSPVARRRLGRILHARATELITHPLVGVLVLLGTPIALYGSQWYAASLGSDMIDEFTQLALLIAGGHYFWTRLQRDPVPKLYPHVVSVGLTFAEVALDVVVPLGIMMSGSLVAADHYLALAGAGGLDPDTDQATGAAILWGLGDLALVPFLVLSMNQLRRRDAAAAADIDRELDAADGDGETRPWWETDPALADRFRDNRRRG